MNALDELITKGQAMLDSERQAAAVAASEQAAARTADRTARIEAVREALGLDEATFAKFAPEYKEGWSPNVALIEQHEVKTVPEMLSLRWRHRLQRSTEFGSIYVAPQVAEVTR